jgi:hypothetical protein
VLKTSYEEMVVLLLIPVLDVSFVLKYGLTELSSIHAVLVPVELNNCPAVPVSPEPSVIPSVIVIESVVYFFAINLLPNV